MFEIAALVAGAALGGWRAKSRGGNGFDIAQYAAIHGLLFGVIAIFISVMIAR